jgi:hypothetical protein
LRLEEHAMGLATLDSHASTLPGDVLAQARAADGRYPPTTIRPRSRAASTRRPTSASRWISTRMCAPAARAPVWSTSPPTWTWWW